MQELIILIIVAVILWFFLALLKITKWWLPFAPVDCEGFARTAYMTCSTDTCETGKERVGGVCVDKCESDEERGDDGVCVDKCESDEERGDDGVCVDKCESDEERGDDGVCITCDPGFVVSGGLCIEGDDDELSGTSDASAEFNDLYNN